MTLSKRLLFIVNCEHGQTQVMLSVASELVKCEGIEPHLASFPALRPRVEAFNANFGFTRPLVFHPIDGPSMLDGLAHYMDVTEMPHPYGVQGAINSFELLPKFLATWQHGDYSQLLESIRSIINEVNPDLIIVDANLYPAIDVCRNSSQQYVLINPNSLSSTISNIQPRGAMFWKYPAIGSGFPYPVPWHLIPANAYIFIRLMLSFIFSPIFVSLRKLRKGLGLKGEYPLFEVYKPDEHYILPSLPEIDFHFDYIPENVTPCGPLVIPHQPLAEVDAKLASWLQLNRTILVNLGSHVATEPDDAVQLAQGLKVALDHHEDVQVLWKLKAPLTGQIRDILKEEIASDRVRITRWLEAEPVAILNTGRICCAIHHGGANSFYEATRAGTPQVILPVWFDTYVFATQAEYLGIGIWGSRDVAPHVEAQRVGQAILDVLGQSDKAISLRKRAEQLSKVCIAAGGRKKACDKVLELLNAPKKAYGMEK